MKNTKIKRKLTSQFLFVAFMTALVSIAGIIGLLEIQDNAKKVITHGANRDIAGRLLLDFHSQESNCKAAIININKNEPLEIIWQDIRSTEASLQELFKELGNVVYSEQNIRRYNEMSELYYNQWLPTMTSLETAIQNNSTQLTETLFWDLASDAQIFLNKTSEIFETISETLSNDQLNSDKICNILVTVFILLACMAILFSILLGSYASNKISKPIVAMASASEKLSTGNLKIEDFTIVLNDEIGTLIKSFKKMLDAEKKQAQLLDELGNGNYSMEIEKRSENDQVNQAILKFVNKMNETLYEILDCSQQVSEASSQIAQGAQSLASGAGQQASSIEEIQQSIEDIDKQTKQNAANIQQANRVNQDAKTIFEDTINDAENVILAMKNINDSSQRITKIINVIEDIAFQTNILALNAAVEAARAGHLGKGFAVVADEVRNLANKSAKAANETAELIETGFSIIHEGNHLVEKMNQSMSTALDNSQNASKLLDEITDASGLLANRIEEITHQITQISSVVQMNSVTAEELSTAAEQLSSQTLVLNGMVNHFKVKERPYQSPSYVPPKN